MTSDEREQHIAMLIEIVEMQRDKIRLLEKTIKELNESRISPNYSTEYQVP